jgi:hypothetical protein
VALEDAIADLGEAVGAFLGSGGRDTAAILSAVFRLDNEIGRRLRSSQDAALKSLQLKVNEVAVAAKRLDRARLATAMDDVRTEALRTKKDTRSRGAQARS